MRIVEIQTLVSKGDFVEQADWQKARNDLHDAIRRIEYPEGSGKFLINPIHDGNGVEPIKLGLFRELQERGWKTTNRKTHANVDGVLVTAYGDYAIEWETGHVTSSHRSMNKLCLRMLGGKLIGGSLVVPSDSLAYYLTDRVSNIGELRAYIELWQLVETRIEAGFLEIIIIEHDETNQDVAQIPKKKYRRG